MFLLHNEVNLLLLKGTQHETCLSVSGNQRIDSDKDLFYLYHIWLTLNGIFTETS